MSLLRNEYLRRLARFALIDGVPTPWKENRATPEQPTSTAAQTDD